MMDARVSRQIGDYHIKQALASGGMGTVYLAYGGTPRKTVGETSLRSSCRDAPSVHPARLSSLRAGRITGTALRL